MACDTAAYIACYGAFLRETGVLLKQGRVFWGVCIGVVGGKSRGFRKEKESGGDQRGVDLKLETSGADFFDVVINLVGTGG